MPHSDKSLKIYNEINFIHNIDQELVENIAINLTLKNKKKISWIFNAVKIPEKNFTNFIINLSKQNNSLNILLSDKNITSKKEAFIKFIMKNYGKKLILLSSKNSYVAKDESIFYSKINKNLKNIESKILETISLI